MIEIDPMQIQKIESHTPITITMNDGTEYKAYSFFLSDKDEDFKDEEVENE